MTQQAATMLRDATGQPWHDGRLAGVHGSVRLEVADCGVWRVLIDDGTLRITEDDSDADCVVRLDADELLKLVSGQCNALTLFLQGRLCVRGAPALALATLRLLPNLPPAMAAD